MNSKVKSVPVQGLDRSSSAGTVKDGSAQEIINLRPLNGVWRNKGEQVEIEKFYSDRIFQGYTEPQFFPDFYRHPSLPEFCYVSYWVDTKTIELYAFCSPQTFNPNWNALSNSQNWVTFNGFWNDAGVWDDNNNVWHDSDIIFTIPLNENFKCFAHLNNILIVTTDKNRYYFIWQNKTLSYTRLEDLPDSFVKLKSNLAPQTSFLYITSDANIAYAYLMGEYYKYIAERKKLGYWEGHNFFRLAYKMYDNSYIPCSEMLYHFSGVNSYTNTDRFHVVYATGAWDMKHVITESIGFQIDLDVNQVAIINLYIELGIIQSICFLSTREMQQYNFGTSFVDWNGYVAGGVAYYIPKPPFELQKLIENINTYYNVYEINKPVASAEYYPFVEKLIDIDTIETYENVVFDTFSNSKFIAETYFNYNDRLHLGNITNILGNGFNLFEKYSNHISDYFDDYTLLGSNPFTTYKLYVEVEINCNNTLKYIRYDVSDSVDVFENTSSEMFVFLHQFVTFPDYRAKNIRILYKDAASETFYLAKLPAGSVNEVLPLTKLQENNIAYYNTYTAPDTANFIPFDLHTVIIYDNYTDVTTNCNLYSVPEIDNLYVDYNRVQVSEQSNVFIYPAKNSYRFGEEDNRVVKLETVAEELSATRFGQFPVYVLTSSQGIWSLEQGSGEILYSNITPIDYSPCNNPNSVCNINGAVVFSTATGLKLIAGRKVIEISSPLEDLYINNPLLGIASYNQLLNTEAFTNLYDVVTKKDTFISKLRSVITSYNREFNELFVTMPVMPFNIWKRPSSDKDYSFVFNKDLRTWYKFKTQFVQFIRTFNGFHAQNFDGTYIKLTDIENESDSSQTFTNFFYQSREIKLENTSFKRIEHIVTRIFTKVNTYLTKSSNLQDKYLRANKFINLHIYGSPDAKEWKLVAGGKSDTTVIRDIMIRKTYASCRYFIFVICGDAKDVELSGFDIQFIDKYVSKIR